MPPEIENQEDMSPEDAKASLGVATRLQEEFLATQNPNPEQPQMEEQEGEEVEEDSEEKQDQKVRTIVQEELATFKEDLMNALNEPDESEKTT